MLLISSKIKIKLNNKIRYVKKNVTFSKKKLGI